MKYWMYSIFWFTVKHQSQTQIAQITPQLFWLRSNLYFRAKLIRIENVILTKRFVSVVVVNENSTPHNAFGISKEFTVYEYKLPHQTV